jgi:hypothetical protein
MKARCVSGDNKDDYQKPFSAVGTIGNQHHADQHDQQGSNRTPVRLAREGCDEFNVARSRSPCAAIQEKAELAMKAIDRRLSRLEEYSSRRKEQDPSPVEVLRGADAPSFGEGWGAAR